MIRQNKVIVALLPLAWIYGLILWARNLLFNYGILRSRKAPVKTLIIGNLTVGGTGKTPHVIWLAQELSKTKNVAILSRGYLRKGKGFQWVKTSDNPNFVGDEALEMKNLLPDIPVAVDANRLRALNKMHRELDPRPDIVILDDGFQHRRLIPDYSIILSNANRSAYSDYLMPAGRLREGLGSIQRANSVIITNTSTKNKIDIKKEKLSFGLSKEQEIFSSSFEYTEAISIVKKYENHSVKNANAILLIAGIANPFELLEDMKSKASIQLLDFPDHHQYSEKDILKIISTFNQMNGENKILITTGKDAVKLRLFPEICELPLFTLGRKIDMERKQKHKLIESILNHG